MASIKAIHLIFVAALVGAVSDAAIAQNAPPPKNPKPQQSAIANAPSMTTATYGDWVVRCSQPTGQQHICEAAQTIYLQGQQTPFALIAIGREKHSEPFRLVVQLPVNVTVSTPVRITVKEGEPALELRFERCVPAGCFAMISPAEEIVKRLRMLAEGGQINFKDAAQRDIGFHFSLRGLAPALDALAKS